jgi:hypothetical protein
MKKFIYILIFFNFSIQLVNAQWVKMNGSFGYQVTSFASVGNNLFAGVGNFKGVFISTDNGLNWTQTSLNNRTITSFTVIGNNLYAGAAGTGRGVYLSSDNGLSWTQLLPGGYNNITSLFAFGNSIFAGGDSSNAGETNYSILRSTNSGNYWSQINRNLIKANAFTSIGSNLFVGSNSSLFATVNGVSLSTNNGSNWAPTSLDYQPINSLGVIGLNLFAGTQNNGVYITTNNGANWSQTSLNNMWISSFAVSGTNLFASVSQALSNVDNGVYLTTNNGVNWVKKNQGLGSGFASSVYSLFVYNNYIYAATYDSSVYRRSISDIIGINMISSEVPNKFSLAQNYPNPFNPITKIKFSISKSAFVKLKIFDAIGREVIQLINENLALGTYETDFDGNELPSGIYYYKLETKDFIETKKMTLLK